MNKEHTAELRKFKCYSKFLNNENFRCLDGWYDILFRLGQELDKLGHIPIIQVKEKFSQLRVYSDWSKLSEDGPTFLKMQSLINSAERESLYVCELCGAKTDNPSQFEHIENSWVYRRCPSCSNRTCSEGWGSSNPLS